MIIFWSLQTGLVTPNIRCNCPVAPHHLTPHPQHLLPVAITPPSPFPYLHRLLKSKTCAFKYLEERDRPMDRPTNGPMDRQTNGPMDRQTVLKRCELLFHCSLLFSLLLAFNSHFQSRWVIYGSHLETMLSL